jgi:ankyrin repeat protein
MVEFLVQNGVDAATQDKLNQTALYYACRDGKVNLAELLVRLGCNVNHQDSNTQTPLFYAAREGHLEVIKRLI